MFKLESGSGKVSIDSTTDKDDLLTNLFMQLIQEAYEQVSCSLRNTAELINEIFDVQTEQCASTYRFLLSTKKQASPFSYSFTFKNDHYQSKNHDEIMQRLLEAIQRCCDDLAMIMLCRLLHGYLTHCKHNAFLRRQRRLLRLDATNCLIKALRSFLRCSDPVPLHLVAVDAISALLLLLSCRDRHFCLKIRLGGLISRFRTRLFSSKEFLSVTLLRVICKSVRSPRNTQLLVGERDFATKFVKRLLGFDSSSLSNAMKMARLVDILFSVIKNKKCKAELLNKSLVEVLKILFERHFRLRLADLTHLELCLIAVACLRHVARTGSGRNELMAKGIIDQSRHAIRAISEDQKRLQQNRSSLLTPLHQLQESLCALCVSCLPLRLFPFHPSSAIPIVFNLPSDVVESYSSCKKDELRRLQSDQLGSIENSVSSSEDDTENEFLFGPDGASVKDNCTECSLSKCRVHGLLKQNVLDLEARYMHLFGEFHEFRRPSFDSSPRKLWSDLFKSQIQRTRGIVPFVKIAFPEFVGASAKSDLCLLNEENVLNKDVIIQQMQRSDSSGYASRVVYNLDQLVMDSKNSLIKDLSNEDLCRVGKLDSTVDHLLFESRFEGGNLRRATQVGPRHYEFLLSPDFNQKKPHFQWFYFEISNIEAEVSYIFEIINCVKSSSMFSSGMQPVLFSVADYSRKRSGWVRAGSSICYYRNPYVANTTVTESSLTKKKTNLKKERVSDARCYFTTKFELVFHNSGDICYIAYHFPYTYSFLQSSLSTMINSAKLVNREINAVSEELCCTLGGNSVPLVTVTNSGIVAEVAKRDIVVFLARVHPGESNSSWMMHGVLEFLLGSTPEAVQLRDNFVFKLIPMLNPDGVVNGSHRCSLAGVDLNRVWDEPLLTLHPTIFHSKGIIQYLVDVLKKPPMVVVDFHGHSRRSNVFMYGNNPEQSWRLADHTSKHNYEFLALPEILAERSPIFSLADCGFGITQGKESSARVVLWRQFHLPHVYTMEASYCGFNRGPYNGAQVNISQLKRLGQSLCESLSSLRTRLDSSLRPPESSSRKAKKTKHNSFKSDLFCSVSSCKN